MTQFDPDRGLREMFSRMRDEDRAHVPAFDIVPATPKARTRWFQIAMALTAAAAIIFATLAVADYRRAAAEREGARSELRRRVVAGTAWRSPTDFLLETSTSELLRTVPTFGPARWTGTDALPLPTRPRS
jgi:hypothetical protein